MTQRSLSTLFAGRTSAETPRWRSALDAVTTVVMLFAAVALLWFGFRDRAAAKSSKTEIPVPAKPVSLQGAHLQGNASANVVLGMFSDFECPYCSRFATTVWPELKRQYVEPGKVAIAFWDFPLAIHPTAKAAAVASTCASAQGKFWELHDLMFSDPKGLDAAGLRRKADAIGLNQPEFAACLGDKSSLAAVEADVELGKGLGVKGTPAFFVGRRKGSSLSVTRTINGAFPLAQFVAALDKELSGGGR